MKDLINISDTQVSINDYPLQVVEYKGERVVSSYDIAKLHNKPVRTVNQQFERHKERLKEGVEYKVNEEVKIKTLVYQKGLDGIRKMLDEAGLLPENR